MASVALSLGLAKGMVGHPFQYNDLDQLQLVPFLGVAFLVLLVLGLLIEGQWQVSGLIVIACLACSGFQERITPKRSRCQNNLKQLALAFHNFESRFHHFPQSSNSQADVRFPFSWRIAILPYIEQQALYDAYRFDEPWDGPNNSKLAERMPAVFRCPSEPRFFGDDVVTTPYLAVTGDGTMFPDGRAGKLRDARNGQSNTVMLVEVPSRRVHWMCPDDISLDDLIALLATHGNEAMQSPHRAGVNFARGDGAVTFGYNTEGPWPELLGMQKLAASIRASKAKLPSSER